MELTTETKGDVAVHRLSGRLDTATSAGAERGILGPLAAGQPRMILDMRDVAYVSSAGLRVVLLAAKQAKAAGGGIALFGLQPAVRDVFDISGFARILAIAPGEAEAEAMLPR
jgi:anti-anti-sigma factor